MNRVYCVLLAGFLFALPAFSQAPVDNSSERKARLHANLMFLFPQLSQYSVTIGAIESSVLEGMEEGIFVINGQQSQRFLTDASDSLFYLLAGGPFNAGLTSEELAAEQLAREREADEQARMTHEALLEAVAGMPAKGPENAPVTIVEFSDFQCPYCAAAADTLQKVLAAHPNDVRLVYVQFPLESIHPWARPASIAALCAADQSVDAFWQLHDAYFANQQAFSTDNVMDQSRSLLEGSGVDLSTWSACAEDTGSDAYQRADAAIDRAMQLGLEYGITSTPAFFVNGRPIRGAQAREAFLQLIELGLNDGATGGE